MKMRAEMFETRPRKLTGTIFWHGFKKANSLTKSSKLAHSLSKFADSLWPDPNSFFVEGEYELFFTIMSGRNRFFTLNSLKNWRKNCKKAICYLIEFWEHRIEDYPFLELLKDFDHIFLAVNHSTELVAKITGVPCTYLPPGVDALKFCPYPFFPHRSIDVCYIGRRSPITHKALKKLEEQGQIFYYYDTAKNFEVLKPSEHRSLLANLIKRSRYLITNKSNVDQPWKTGQKEEIGYRFFEGAAAGAIMMGDYPKTEVFRKYFDWSDSVIEISYDMPNIGEIIADLNKQNDRLKRIRRNNMVNSLLRHDWVYRWRKILETVGLKPSSAILSREAYLQKIAQEIQTRDSF